MDATAQQEQPNGRQATEPASQKSQPGHGLLSRLPFMRTSSNDNGAPIQNGAAAAAAAAATAPDTSKPTSQRGAMATASQQQQQQQIRTRRRKGSLRKVALLGRGAQRDRRDSSPLTIEVPDSGPSLASSAADATPKAATTITTTQHDALGIDLSELTPRPSMDGFASRTTSFTNSSVSSSTTTNSGDVAVRDRESLNAYNSTTDEEDLPQIPLASTTSMRLGMSMPSASDSYFGGGATQRRPSFHQAKSPLSFPGLTATPIQTQESDWDYAETEWWGWVVLTVTWFVFVIGMGSCLGIWSWAWDVGKTPYAPPELEDDPTLPIVGYYPTLIILTCVMAWVWVVVAWVGMKYFRHAKISGD